MILEPAGYIDLPPHRGSGGFDHAAVHRASGRIVVAHTANDAIDIIDGREDRYVRSISGLRGVAGVLTSDERDLVFTSNRSEDTVSVFAEGQDAETARVKVGVHPNGLAFAPARGLLLVANVGHPDAPGSASVSLVNVDSKTLVADLPAPGRTRWPVYDDKTRAFYVAIRDPPQIAVIDVPRPDRIARSLPVPAAGPHGLDLDAVRGRLFCACDAGTLVVLNRSSGEILCERPLSGPPDVVFLNEMRHHLYVAVGDPGVIDVFDTETLERVETSITEKGAHTIGYDAARSRVYAFLPESHRVAIYEDAGPS